MDRKFMTYNVKLQSFKVKNRYICIINIIHENKKSTNVYHNYSIFLTFGFTDCLASATTTPETGFSLSTSSLVTDTAIGLPVLRSNDIWNSTGSASKQQSLVKPGNQQLPDLSLLWKDVIITYSLYAAENVFILFNTNIKRANLRETHI